MILVTGAGGTVGREVRKALKVRNAAFKSGYSTEVKAEAARARGETAVVADFARPDTLGAALEGCDHLFLLSGGLPNQSALEIAAVRAAKASGVEHVVKLSVWGAEEERFSFARLHRPVEREIERSGMGWTHLRPTGFMQNVVNFMAATIKTQNAIYQPAGDAAVGHVDVRDVAEVAAEALTRAGHQGHAYALTGPESLTFGQIAEKLTTILGRPIRYVDVPEEAAREAMLGMGLEAWYVEAILDLTRYYKDGRSSRLTGDVRKVLGREPISFDRFLRDHADALR